jgi:hypothetical protein
MSKFYRVFLLLLVITLIPVNLAKADNLSKKLSGRILLQFESHGQAWYVNPANQNRYYMADGNAAFNVMRNLGVGITNSNLVKLQKNKNLAIKQSGKIFLQVEGSGQAYYINVDGTLYYLKDGNVAYNIMKSLGLGIKNNDLYKIPEDVLGQSATKKQNSSSEKNLSDIVKEWSPRVGQILCSWWPMDKPSTFSVASGFIMELNNEPAVLTNKHVILNNNSSPDLCTVKFFSTNNVISGSPTNSNENSTALYATDGTDWGFFVPYNAITSKEIKNLAKKSFSVCSKDYPNDILVGDNIAVIGYPAIGSQTSVTVTKGIISAIDNSYYITDAKIDHGNSGGIAILLKHNCYLGISSAAVTGEIESLGRILDAKVIFGK